MLGREDTGHSASPEKRQARVVKAREIAEAGGTVLSVANAFGISKPAAKKFLDVWAPAEVTKKLRDNASPGPNIDRAGRIRTLVAHDWKLSSAAKALDLSYVGLYLWVCDQTGNKLAGMRELADELEPECLTTKPSP